MIPAATEAEVSREKLAEVERLAMALAARLRYAQIVGLPVPDGQVSALERAARILTDCRVPQPALIRQVLKQATDGNPHLRDETEADPGGPGLLARLGRRLLARGVPLPETP